MPARGRPTINENGEAVDLSDLAFEIGICPRRLGALLEERSRLIRSQLRPRSDPFAIEGECVATTGVAGVVQLLPGVELEIVPKCFTAEDPQWRDDFLLMATVTRHSRILRRNRVSASHRTRRDDLLTILASIFLDEMERLLRLPIREYRSSAWASFEIDGELEYGRLWEPSPEGFEQTGTTLTIDNDYMRTINAAAAFLASASIDRGVSSRLQRLVSLCSAPASFSPPPRVPSRYARWQELYDLAKDVLAGHGMRLVPKGASRAPGFLLDTERCWEDLLALGLTGRGTEVRATVKPRLVLGVGYQGPESQTEHATPDFVLYSDSLSEPIVVDAKYKGTSDHPIARIDRADLYEALGFLAAAGSSIAILLYPAGGSDSPAMETGSVTMFHKVQIGTKQIIGAVVEMRGISRFGGMTEFSQRLGHDLLAITADGGVPSV